MLRRDGIFRDRSHLFDTDICRSVNLQEIQIQTKRHCDHNRQHWQGYCDQQSDQFLKLTPVCHCLIVGSSNFARSAATSSNETLTLFPAKCAFSHPFMCLDFYGYPRNENRGERVQLNKHLDAADDRRQTADKAWPISTKSSTSFAMHCRQNNEFSRSKNEHKRLAIQQQIDELCLRTESRTYLPLSKSGLGAIRL